MNPDKHRKPTARAIPMVKSVKVKAFNECAEIVSDAPGSVYQLIGHVTEREAKLLDKVLKLYRKPSGHLEDGELPIVAHLLALQV